MFGGKKREGLQAEEQHPNREARGWQHHVVLFLKTEFKCIWLRCMYISDFNCTLYI